MIIGGIDYKIATSKEEMRKAYELVYQNYVEKKFCKLNHHRMRIFLFDSLLETRTFIAKEGDDVLATATLVFDSPIGLPSDGIYKDRIDELRREGKKICEFSKLSTKKDLGTKALRILPNLFRSCWLYAKEINKHSHFCILVEPRNEEYYLKSYFFEKKTAIRLDAKAEDAESIFLEMPIEVEVGASIDKNNSRDLKRYYFHFEDPDIRDIVQELKDTEEEISKINISLQEPRQRRTLALTSEEKKCLEFKFFIIGYNLEQINKNALSQTFKGSNHEAAESYENLMKTLPNWAFGKEKDAIYEKLCDLFFTMGSFTKVIEVATKLRNSTNNNNSVQGRNLQALGQYASGNHEEALKNLKKAEILSRESNDNIRLTCNLQIQGMIQNFHGNYEEALVLVNEAIQAGEKEVPFRSKTYLFLTTFFINSHLGKIRACAEIVKKFKEEIPDPDTEDHFKAQLTYLNCMARYHMLILQNKKAKYYIEKILDKVISKDEMPYNYAVYLTNYAAILISLGEIKEALKVNSEILLLKEHYPLKSYCSYLVQRLNIFLYLCDSNKVQESKKEIEIAVKKLGHKLEDFLEFKHVWILEMLLMGNFDKALELVKSLPAKEIWNKPQLSAGIDMTTIHLLVNKPRVARKYLEATSASFENEIVGTEIDNRELLKIYDKLIDEYYNHLENDIENLFQKIIDENEVMAKATILFFIIQILEVQNKKKAAPGYAELRKYLLNKLESQIKDKGILAIEEFITKRKN